tara:strand:- start:910 stop:1473 length:564 start_codon:yes stop_codon:yes gene_type:complete
MVYTKLNKVGDTPTLSHYCKNCGWENVIEDTKGPVYQRNYEEDHIADKALSNKYTIFDVTLPRVQYDCVNPRCASMRDLDASVSLFIENIPEDMPANEFNELFTSVSDNLAEEPQRVYLSQGLVICKSPEDKEKVRELFEKKIVDNHTLYTKEYVKPNKEILYLKYDPTNMKYLYLCAVCGTSWKKT